ncbi:14052_t:CDS:2, partial [Gigaspora margarita]
HIQEQGYEATIFDRNPISHHKKEVNIKLSISILKTIATNNPGIFSKLKSKTHFYSLDNCYRSFAYGLGSDPTGEMKVLKITDREIK